METTVLTDPAYTVPQCPPAETGIAWLRANVARFSDGPAHTRRRRLIDDLLAALTVVPRPGADPTATLLAALGLPPELAADVDTIATAYHPHQPATREADTAVERLATACGGHDEQAAAKICVLVQAHAATRALITQLRSGGEGPPVPVTRRVDPHGRTVEVDLTEAPYGAGPHACPGRDLAQRLARAAISHPIP
ncbi:hypothetical protein [Spirillospora sp. CA-294931]|uniref:hypothetical protein n=1 Tax=Spirillospora sp. CA-294931 TaxID=3240042 RepID=UPI003D9334C5